MLKTHDEIVSVAGDDDIARCVPLAPLVRPHSRVTVIRCGDEIAGATWWANFFSFLQYFPQYHVYKVK